MYNNIRAARIARKLTQETVAASLKVTRQAYGRYESGERECNYETLCRLSSMFDVSVDYLLGRTASDTLATAPALSRSEVELLRKYKQLDLESRGKLNTFLDFLLSQASAPAQKERAVK